MAATLQFFALPEDELALFRALGRHGLTLYPELVPPGYRAPAVDEQLPPGLELPAYYLAAERLGPVVVRPVKRGPDKGLLAVEEIPSPVLHLERSLVGENGELVSGRLWAELDVNDDPGSREGKPRGLRTIFEDLQAWVRKTWRRSDPKGWWVGVEAARGWKSSGLVLREAGHKGKTVGVWR